MAYGQVSLAIAHSSDRLDQRRILHPTKENIPTGLASAYVLEPTVDPVTVAPDLLAHSNIADTIYIGVNEGPDYEMLGDIRDIAHDVYGRVYLLDSSIGTVRIFNSDGSYHGSFGRAGTGPGEVTYAEDLAISDSGNVAVVVARSGRSVVFERAEHGGFEYRNGFSHHGIIMDDACIMNGHLFLIGYKPDSNGNIYKLTFEGELINTFGSVYKSRNTYVASRLSRRGKIACSEPSGVIGAVKEQVPALTGYSEDGALLWTVRFEGIELARVEERGRSLSFPRPGVGEGWLYSLFADAAGRFNVVYIVSSGEKGEAPYHVFRINARNGLGTYAGHSRGLVGMHTRYVIQNRPFKHPGIRLIRLGN